MFRPENLGDTSAKTTVKAMDDAFFLLAKDKSMSECRDISVNFFEPTQTYSGILQNQKYIESHYLGLGWGECQISQLEGIDVDYVKVTLVKKPEVPLQTNVVKSTMRILERIQKCEKVYVDGPPENPWWKRAINWCCRVDDPKDKPTKVETAGRAYWDGVVVFDKEEATPYLGQPFSFEQDGYIYSNMYLAEPAIVYSEYQFGKKYFAYVCPCILKQDTYASVMAEVEDLVSGSIEASFEKHSRKGTL